MSNVKRGPKLKPYTIVVLNSEKKISELELARIEKILRSILVNAQEEVANEGKSNSGRLLQGVV